MKHFKSLLSIAVLLAAMSPWTQVFARTDNRPSWPVYYYGDPQLQSAGEDAAHKAARIGLLRSRFPPSSSFLIITGELISGPDYCVAVIRITAQSTVPPYLYRSSAGSSHTIWNGTPGACPGVHPIEAGRLALEEFSTQLRKEATRAEHPGHHPQAGEIPAAQ